MTWKKKKQRGFLGEMEKKFFLETSFSAQGHVVVALLRMLTHFESNTVEIEDVLPLVVFTAFSFEAYLNSVGERKLSNWSELERKPWKEKVKLLHQGQEKEMNWQGEVGRLLVFVFTTRDRLAHGKPETIRATEPSLDSNEASLRLRFERVDPHWFNDIRQHLDQDFRRKVELVFRYFAELFGLDAEDYKRLSQTRIVED